MMCNILNNGSIITTLMNSLNKYLSDQSVPGSIQCWRNSKEQKYLPSWELSIQGRRAGTETK